MPKVGLRRVRLVAAALVLGSASMVGVSAQAGAGSSSLNVDPTTVEAGGQIRVSQYCSSPSTVDVAVFEGWTDPWTDPAGSPIVEATDIAPDEGAQWSVDLTIPLAAAPGSYTVWAQCSSGSEQSYRYGSIELTVTASTTPTTTPVTPSTTDPGTTGSTTTATTTTVVSRPAAVAATPVAGRPTYTG
jgi:hypothetical protein